MGNLRNRIIGFLRGRYARLDTLGGFMLILYAALCIVNAVVGSVILSVVILLIVILTFARMLSRNIPKRYAENMRFVRFLSAAKREVKLFFDRLRFMKTNRFRKCPHCKAITKLPNKRGRHSVRCPRCSEKFDVRIL